MRCIHRFRTGRFRTRSVPDQPVDDVPTWTFEIVDDHDTPAEVDASVRTLRRVAVGHVVIFLGVVLLVPVLTLALDWWSRGRLIGGMSPNFAMAAVGLYVFFFVLSIIAAHRAKVIEDRMLGNSAPDPPGSDSGEDTVR